MIGSKVQELKSKGLKSEVYLRLGEFNHCLDKTRHKDEK
jgi:hypothetical protein